MNTRTSHSGLQRPLRQASIILVLLAGACATPPPRPPQVEITPAPASTTPPGVPADPTLVSVTAVSPPPKLLIDGDLAEWGSLLPLREPAAPPSPAKLPNTAQQAPEVPLPSGPNPGNAVSHLAFALTNEAVLIAAELGEPARAGIWLGIGSMSPAVPPIGIWARGGFVESLDCEFEQVYINEGMFEKGAAKPPEVVAACRELLARHVTFVAEHRARFSRLLKIDAEGVRELKSDGNLATIAGARAVFKPRAKGASVEIALPLAAMPRLVEAPLQTLHLVARAVTTPKPELAPEQWVWVRFPDPVAFEPLGEIRARAVQILVDNTYHPTGLSYHPADPLHVQTLRYMGDPSSVDPGEEKLYEKLATLGDIEVGQVTAFGAWLAILKKGKLVGADRDASDDVPFDAFPPSERKGILTRDGSLHVISYSAPADSEGMGPRTASWSALVIAPDGTAHDAVESVDLPYRWDDVTAFTSPDLATFGLRGTTNYPGQAMDFVEKAEGLEVSYRWDPAQKKYLATRTRSAAPKKAKATKRTKKK